MRRQKLSLRTKTKMIDWRAAIHMFLAALLAQFSIPILGNVGKVLLPPIIQPIDIGNPVPPHVPPVKPLPKADPLGAMIKVRHGNAFCSGVHLGDVMKSGHSYYITAAHCTGVLGSGVEVEMLTKQRITCRVVSRDTKADISICRYTAVVDYPFAVVHNALPEVGSKVWHKGYGVDRPGSLEKGEVTQADDSRKQTTFRLSVSNGDSGAPIYLEATGEIVGVVCCSGNGRMYGGNGPAIWSMLATANQQGDELIDPVEIPERNGANW